MLKFRLAAVAVLCLCLVDAGFAQRPGSRRSGRRGRRSLEKAPAVGKPLPNLTVYDSEGKEFKTDSLKGHHTVLVFGCLT